MTQEPKPEEGSILHELTVLGQQLGSAVKALWESEESKTLRADIAEGIAEVGRQIDTAVQSAQESEAAKEFSTQVRATVEKAREADVAEQIEQGLVSGLRELNTHLAKLVSSWDTGKAPEPEAPPPPPNAEPKA